MNTYSSGKGRKPAKQPDLVALSSKYTTKATLKALVKVALK
jgi:hypothetical protein